MSILMCVFSWVEVLRGYYSFLSPFNNFFSLLDETKCSSPVCSRNKREVFLPELVLVKNHISRACSENWPNIYSTLLCHAASKFKK